MTAISGRFAKKMTASMGQVHEVGSINKVPAKVLEIVKNLKIKPKAVAAAGLKSLNWGKMAVEFRPAEISDVLGISMPQFGIAETGTLIFGSSKEDPASLNFVPEFSIAILKTSVLVETSEEVWAALVEKGPMPRTLNMISGPSKTGDIEQTLFLGAHGPRELHVILVKD
ncbi:MAG: LutC/YkgG family protein [Alphaproteobacteria bacterium]